MKLVLPQSHRAHPPNRAAAPGPARARRAPGAAPASLERYGLENLLARFRGGDPQLVGRLVVGLLLAADLGIDARDVRVDLALDVLLVPTQHRSNHFGDFAGAV